MVALSSHLCHTDSKSQHRVVTPQLSTSCINHFENKKVFARLHYVNASLDVSGTEQVLQCTKLVQIYAVSPHFINIARIIASLDVVQNADILHVPMLKTSTFNLPASDCLLLRRN